MLIQQLNGNNGLLLILTPNNTDLSLDLSLLSVSVTVKKCDCIFSLIKVLDFNIKLMGIFKI